MAEVIVPLRCFVLSEAGRGDSLCCAAESVAAATAQAAESVAAATAQAIRAGESVRAI